LGWGEAESDELDNEENGHDGPQRPVGIEDDRPRGVALDDLVNFLGPDPGLGVLTLGLVPRNDNMADALLGEDLQTSFQE